LIIGGKGTIGKRVAAHFALENELVIAGRSSGEVKVDISDSSSIEAMFEKAGSFDAIICIAGQAKWMDFKELSEEDYYVGLKSKLMGQVNVVRIGQHYLNQNGSITLTTGILADNPVKKTTSAALVNGGLHSFVKAVSLEIPCGIRVNVVSPGLVEDSYEKLKGYFPGYTPVPMDKVVKGYIRSVFGRDRGAVIRIY
jgi:NAD(P)-dependent dehydrogenase (short-subunit alcohol dehydrogenase family)